MRKKLLSLLLFLGLFANGKLFAQTDIPKSQRPTRFVSYFDAGFGTSGGELGLSARIYPQIATALFVHFFFNRIGASTNLGSTFLTGAKAKFYQDKIAKTFYIGPLFALHNFDSDLRPLIGFNTGFDNYSQAVIFSESMHLRLGIGLQGGIDIQMNGYIGLGVSIGIGYDNNGGIRSVY